MTNQPLRAASAIDPAIVGDIKRASQATNIDFAYLMAQARQESGFQPDAKAPTSSATGLYQFIDETWLSAVKLWGAKYGLGQYAAQISMSETGQASVADPAARQRILNLRTDPAASASLAAELAKQNKSEVERGLGRPASATDLYLAHFLGAAGATEFVKTIEHDGTAKAADLLPQAAAANRWVFYDEGGQAKTVAQIYRNFADRMEGQTGTFAAAGAGASDDPFSPGTAAKTETPSLLATMNVLTLAALKLLGRREPDQDVFGNTKAEQKNETDASA